MMCPDGFQCRLTLRKLKYIGINHGEIFLQSEIIINVIHVNNYVMGFTSIVNF